MSKMPTISAIVNPVGSMNVLSSYEVQKLQDSSKTGLYQSFRQCALAVLKCESQQDDAKELMDAYSDFDIRILPQPRGIKLELLNAPAHAFVNGALIKGVREQLFAVVRDILSQFSLMEEHGLFELKEPQDISNLIFNILRNAQAFVQKQPPNIVVCWGGHAIGHDEYAYTKTVGYELGLREFDICTGCGPGAMKGPMKGAYIGHAKQRITNGRFIGLTEPGIIAAESPNPIVNELIIMPDIEKRLEAFVRLGHSIIVFPGGPGTAEEILYLLGVMLHERNREIVLPLIFTGPKGSEAYFQQIDEFIGATLGKKAQSLYTIIIDNPKEVATRIQMGMKQVTQFRQKSRDAYYFNWQLFVDRPFQEPFNPTHDTMSKLHLSTNKQASEIASTLRRAMSGIVAGNIKESAASAIEKKGPFVISGEHYLMQRIDKLLSSFVSQHRMKIKDDSYKPCYVLKKQKNIEEITS